VKQVESIRRHVDEILRDELREEQQEQQPEKKRKRSHKMEL
jgi:hypothetical protein